MAQTAKKGLNFKDFHNIDKSGMVKEFIDFLEYIDQINELQYLKKRAMNLAI